MVEEEKIVSAIEKLTQELKKTSPEFSSKMRRKELEEKNYEFSTSTGKTFSQKLSEIAEYENEDVSEIKEKRKQIKILNDEISKSSGIIESDEYEKLLEQINDTDKALKKDLREKFSAFESISRFTENLGGRGGFGMGMMASISAQSPLLGMGISGISKAGSMLFSSLKNISGKSDTGSRTKEDLLESLQRDLASKRNQDQTIPTKRKKSKEDFEPYLAEPAIDYSGRGLVSNNDSSLLERILFTTEEAKEISSDSREILSKLLKIEEEIYESQEEKNFKDLENQREEIFLRKKQLQFSPQSGKNPLSMLGDNKVSSSDNSGLLEKATNIAVQGYIGGKVGAKIGGIVLSKTKLGKGLVGLSAVMMKFLPKINLLSNTVGSSVGILSKLSPLLKFFGGKLLLPLGLGMSAYAAGTSAKKDSEDFDTSEGSAFSARFISDFFGGVNDMVPFLPSTKSMAKTLDYTKPIRDPIGFGVEKLREKITGKKEEPKKAKPMNNVSGGLGSTTARSESGNDPGRISSGAGDFGGKSYGIYQLASNTGTLQKFIEQSGYSDVLGKYKIGSAEFDEKWKSIAKTDPNFAKAQHDFIEKTHYGVQASKLQNLGLDVSSRGPGLKEAVFSTATQYGPNTSVIEKALQNKNLESMSDADIISAIQDYKLANLDSTHKSSSAAVRKGVGNRIMREKQELIEKSNLENNIQIAQAPRAVETSKASQVDMLSKSNAELKDKQLASNNINIKQVGSPAPGATNGPMPSGSKGTAVRHTESTIINIAHRNFRGTTV